MRKGTDAVRVLPFALFTMFWTAQTVSLFGDRLSDFSLAALINKFAEDPSLSLSKLYLAMFLPVFTLAPLIGALVDRLHKGWTLVVADLVRGALVCLIPIVFMRTGSFYPIFGIVFAMATLNLFFLPAKSSIIPELVPGDQLIRVNSILWGAGIAGVVGGFLGGGFIFDLLSWQACFYMDGITYIVSALLLVGIALHHARAARAAAPREHPQILQAIREGVDSIKSSPTLLRPIVMQSLLFFGGGGFSVLAIVLIRQASPGSSLALSAAGLALGVGMGVGSALVNARRRLGGNENRAEAALFGLFLPASLVIAIGHGIPAVAGGTFLAGLAAAPLIIIAESEIQGGSNEHLRGRIFALREVVTRSFFLASAFIFSGLGNILGKNILLGVLGLLLASGGIFWIILSKRLIARSGL